MLTLTDLPMNSFPVGSTVRIVANSSGHHFELFDTYIVKEIRGTRLRVRDDLWRVADVEARDCCHPGVGWEWAVRNCEALRTGSEGLKLLRNFTGKRFLRLRPSIRDRILLRSPNLKEAILECLGELESSPEST